VYNLEVLYKKQKKSDLRGSSRNMLLMHRRTVTFIWLAFEWLRNSCICYLKMQPTLLIMVITHLISLNNYKYHIMHIR